MAKIIYGKICSCGNDTWDKTLSDDDKPIWKCTNCREERVRRPRKNFSPRKGSKKWYINQALELMDDVHTYVPSHDRYHWDVFVSGFTLRSLKKRSLTNIKWHYDELVKTIEVYKNER